MKSSSPRQTLAPSSRKKGSPKSAIHAPSLGRFAGKPGVTGALRPVFAAIALVEGQLQEMIPLELNISIPNGLYSYSEIPLDPSERDVPPFACSCL